MKIAHLTSTFSAFSGIDRVVEQQAKELSEQGNKVTIFALEADLKPPRNAELQVIGMPKSLFWQRIYRLFFPLDFVKALKWVPKLENYDIIYSHQYPMNWLAYLAKKFYSVKYIYYDYGIAPPWTFSNFIERTYIRMISFLANWTIKRADGAISISQYLQQQLKQKAGLVSEVVHPKIDTTRFHRGLDGSKIRDKYKLGANPIVLYVGRISPHKGVHLLIQAFNLVKREIPNAKLLIVGKHTFAGYSKKLRQMADDSVIFAGYVADEEIPYCYAACAIYATASLWEGFDLPLAEAQACGKPVVAFNIGPHPEVVIDSETGFLVVRENIIALSQAMIKVLKDNKLRQEMGANAYKAVRGGFLGDDIVSRL